MNAKRAMKVLACADKFKDSLDAKQVGDVVLKTLSKNFGHITTQNIPLSDGGDGFIQAIVLASSGNSNRRVQIKQEIVTGPLGEAVKSDCALVTVDGEQDTFAVVEMAKTSGLELVPVEKRNPFNTTTKGLGELIMKLYRDEGVRRVLLGIGGSATIDAGLGALNVLGVKTICKSRDKTYQPDTFYGKHLLELERIDVSPLRELHLHIDIACDVENPFLGPEGAVHTFGKQKGLLTQELRDTMEQGMVSLAALLHKETGMDVSNMKGAGAAGGIAGGFYASFNADLPEDKHVVALKKGIKVIAEYVELEKHISESELVITGEGSYDEQTAQGKVVSWVENLCKKHKVPCVVVCGKSVVNSQPSREHMVLDLMSMFELEQSMKETAKCLELIVEKNLSHFESILSPSFKT